tara:strand:- start:1758 stop:1964 length:207 start_codon:yes stop_codon:yes gene_type:complete
MKFALTIWVCSFLDGTCSPPITFENIFNTWDECVVKAQQFSIELQNTDPTTNTYRIATKFACKEINDI